MLLARKKLGSKGVTLMETMLAVLVFGTVVGTMMEVAAQNLTMGKRADQVYNSYCIAKNHIETIKALPFSDAANAAESNVLVDSLGVPTLSGDFKRSTTVSTNYTGDTNLVSITVSVDYKVRGAFAGKPTSVSTVIFQYA